MQEGSAVEKAKAEMDIIAILNANLPGFLSLNSAYAECKGDYTIKLSLGSETAQYQAPTCCADAEGKITVSQMCASVSPLNDTNPVMRIKARACPCTEYSCALPASSAAQTKLDENNIIPLLWLGLNCYFNQGDKMSFTNLLAQCQYEGDIWKKAMLRCHFTHHCCHEKTENKSFKHQTGRSYEKRGAGLFSRQREATLNFAKENTMPLASRWLHDSYQSTLLNKFLEDEATPVEVLQLMRTYIQSTI